MNRLLKLLFSRHPTRLVDQLAERVARNSHAELVERVREKTAGMGLFEIRGYVRAHAGRLVEREVEAALKGHRSADHLRPHVVARATEQLVSLVVRQLLRTESPRRRPAAAA